MCEIMGFEVYDMKSSNSLIALPAPMNSAVKFTLFNNNILRVSGLFGGMWSPVHLGIRMKTELDWAELVFSYALSSPSLFLCSLPVQLFLFLFMDLEVLGH